MYLLDSNVVSELRRPHRTDPRVEEWADSASPEDMFLSSITVLELETGARLLARPFRTGEMLPPVYEIIYLQQFVGLSRYAGAQTRGGLVCKATQPSSST